LSKPLKQTGAAMNKLFVMLSLICLGGYASTSVAEGTFGNRYVGASIGFLKVEPKVIGNADLTNAEVRAGGFLNNYMAAEVRGSLGLVGDEIGGVDVDLLYSFGAYMRIGTPFLDKFFPYVLLGVTRTDIDLSSVADDAIAETDTSIGVGIDYNFDSMALSAEYAQYIDKSGSLLTGVTLGISTSF
jgi:hypothetical protein